MGTYLRYAIALSLLAALLIAPAASWAQETPSLLTIDVENGTVYFQDTNDLFMLARTATAVAPKPPANFYFTLSFGDIVAVNGDPVKGTLIVRTHQLSLSPNATPGMASGDINRGAIAEAFFEILNPDGTQIGTIYHRGLSAGTPPPGAPPGAVSGSGIIVGGTGPFVGARGSVGLQAPAGIRMASMAEDPSMRKALGGGKWRYVLNVYPMFKPDIFEAAAGVPAVYHQDGTLVTADNPAQAGETLTAMAKGLGPTRPSLDPGEMFPSDPPAVVSSPVRVFVNDNAVQALNQIGLPETADSYRIDFGIPDATPSGTANIQLSCGWMTGTVVRVPVR